MTTEQCGDATSEADGTGHSPQWFRRNPALHLAYRIAVGVVGAIVLIAGIVLIPYPGPGWLVVFAGLAILATEFTWADRVLKLAKRHYDAWVQWLKEQSTLVKLALAALTCVVVIVSCWLLGAFSLVGGRLGIDETWIESPIM